MDVSLNVSIETSRLRHVFRFTSNQVVPSIVSPAPTQSPLLVYIVCLSITSSCVRLYCYVFVCLGNGFQVAIVSYVTWWLMGKIYLLLLHLSSLSKPPLYTHRVKNKSHPILLTKWLTGFRMHPFFFFDQRAFKSRGPFYKQGWICATMTWKEKLSLYAWTVWGFFHSLAMLPHGEGLIGGPKELPVLSPKAHKDIRVRSGRGLEGAGGSHSGDEQVSHRITGWDELGECRVRMVGGCLPLGCKGTWHTRSFIHSLIHGLAKTHTQWGFLVPVAGLLLYKWSKADPHSQPCVRLPFIPQPSWNSELWVFSGAPCLLSSACTGAPCGTTLFTPTQGQ